MRLKVLKVQITKIYLFSILHANFKTYPLQLFIQRSLKLTTEHFLCCWMYVCLGGLLLYFLKSGLCLTMRKRNIRIYSGKLDTLAKSF